MGKYVMSAESDGRLILTGPSDVILEAIHGLDFEYRGRIPNSSYSVVQILGGNPSQEDLQRISNIIGSRMSELMKERYPHLRFKKRKNKSKIY